MSNIKHLPPNFYTRDRMKSSNWMKINYCCKCKLHGCKYQMHEVNPCPNCGNEVKTGKIGKWIEPEYKWSWSSLWFKEVKKGYWKFKKD